jgi:hypothetical protein
MTLNPDEIFFSQEIIKLEPAEERQVKLKIKIISALISTIFGM